MVNGISSNSFLQRKEAIVMGVLRDREEMMITVMAPGYVRKIMERCAHRLVQNSLSIR
jgi:hypothetical protein